MQICVEGLNFFFYGPKNYIKIVIYYIKLKYILYTKFFISKKIFLIKINYLMGYYER